VYVRVAGKTSLRNRYAKGHFSQAYIATIGADFVTKKVEIQQQDGSAPAPASTVTLQLWDTGALMPCHSDNVIIELIGMYACVCVQLGRNAFR